MKRRLRGLLAAVAIGTTAALSACGLAEPLVFEIVPTTLDLKVGETAQLQVRVLDANGELVPDRTASYLSVNPGVASVSQAGAVTAVSSGATQIELSAEGVAGSVPVTVIPTMTGSWSGSFSVSGGSVTLSMTLVESATESIVGTGAFIIGSVGLQFDVTGTHLHPDVELTIASPNVEPARLTGQFIGDDFVSAQLFDSGFTGEAVTLTRQSGALVAVARIDSPNSADLATTILTLLGNQ